MQFQTPDGPLEADIRDVIVAGWTGRDTAAVQHHIDELAAIGVAPPSDVPLFYRVSRDLLTQSPGIQVMGADTSGEVEPLLINAGGKVWLGLASDQTDRALEAHSVAASKQVCAKPVASHLWPLDAISNHLDDLILRCWIEEDGAWTLYQDGPLAMIRPLLDLAEQADLEDGAAMLCGTLPAIGGVRPAKAYRMALEDPVLQARIDLDYHVDTLPIVA